VIAEGPVLGNSGYPRRFKSVTVVSVGTLCALLITSASPYSYFRYFVDSGRELFMFSAVFD
jgi:hypothetical protein